MVHGIVKSHGGHIECHSQLGLGTTFTIYLAALKHAEVVPGEESGKGVEVAGGLETVLLVDDEESLRLMGQRILTAMGYRVIVARSGEQALGIYQERGIGIQLVVMDLGMPGMGGHRALKAIRAFDPEAKVVIASGYAANDQVKAALDSGAVGYVAKPFRKADLLATVRGVLDNK
jgi:CheY-like chemotaxis protein